jgi:hypothetical protein
MWPTLCLAALVMWADAPQPMRGVLVDREGDAEAGQISVRAPDFFVHVFRCDARTEIWREGRMGNWMALRPGDVVEIFCSGAMVPRCRAESIRVVTPAAERRTGGGLPRWIGPDWNSGPFPRGNLLVAGAITEVHSDHLRLRLRGGARQFLRLREDTRFVADGLPVERPELRVNMRVFVRAGRSLEGELEAFQVMWGRILPAR